jgi:hypothetical protein
MPVKEKQELTLDHSILDPPERNTHSCPESPPLAFGPLLEQANLLVSQRLHTSQIKSRVHTHEFSREAIED